MPNTDSNNQKPISCKQCRVVLPTYKRYLVFALAFSLLTFSIGYYVGTLKNIPLESPEFQEATVPALSPEPVKLIEPETEEAVEPVFEEGFQVGGPESAPAEHPASNPLPETSEPVIENGSQVGGPA